MKKKNIISSLRSIWSKYQSVFFKLFFVAVIIIAPIYCTQVNKNRIPVSSNHFSDFFDATNEKPTARNFLVPEDEDKAYLDSILKKIFPYGSFFMSDEHKSIEVLRFVSSYMKVGESQGNATQTLKSGQASCGGFSYVYKILLRRLGIPTRYIGLFYIPELGSHALTGVYYDNAWHLFDPFFGIFVYSGQKYDQKGHVLSTNELRDNVQAGSMQTVLDSPWKGTYNQDYKKYGVKALSKDYLTEFTKQYTPNYSGDFGGYWRNAISQAFPIALGADSVVSFPIDADLTKEKILKFGQVDHDYNDMATYSSGLKGTNYLGYSTAMPNTFNTWNINVDSPKKDVTIKYYWWQNAKSNISVIPLRSTVVRSIDQQEGQTIIKLTVLNNPGVFMVINNDDYLTLDAIEVVQD